MTFEEWYEDHVKYMNLADFKPWLSEAWDAALEEAANKAWDVAPSDEAAEKIAAAIRSLK
jgi:hypothetical protein